MKESDIRRSDLVQETQRLYKKDQERILRHASQFVEVNCPACDTAHRKIAWYRDGFTFCECEECETIYVSPRPTPLLLQEHYRLSLSEAFWVKEIYPESEARRIEKLIRPRVEKVIEFVNKYSVNTSSLIDVGAGYGTFCQEIKLKGLFKEIIAIETNPSPAKVCLDKGINTLNMPVEEVNNISADVVTCFEIIEHLFSPRVFIEKLIKLVNPGGLIVITTPNIKGFDLITLRDKSDNTTAPDHINYFHSESLMRLLKSCSLEILEVLTPGKLDAELVRNKVIAGDYDVTNQPFLKYILLQKWEELGDGFQQYLANNCLSSNLWIAARKPN